jgi:hypothetical protein
MKSYRTFPPRHARPFGPFAAVLTMSVLLAGVLPAAADAQPQGRTGDWGVRRTVAPVIDYREGAGLILGARAARTRIGFRRVPVAARAHVDAMFALDARAFGLELGIFHPWEGSPWSLVVNGHASRFDAFRFYGLGNDTRAGDHDLALVRQDRAWIEPGVAVEVSRTGQVAFGVRADWTGPDVLGGSPLAASRLPGTEPFALASVWAQAVVANIKGDTYPVRGVHALAGVSGTPAMLDVNDAFGNAYVDARTYFTFGPTLALRAGGQKSWGAFPAQRAAFIGGRTTVRGFRHQRFAGDAALHGSAELRVPIARVAPLVRGAVGVIGFTDAGRVFVDGTSPGGWHTGVGGGLWYASRAATFSGTWARGEEGRVYFSLGMPF